MLRTVDPQTMLLAGNNISKTIAIESLRENQSVCQRDELTAAGVEIFDALSSEPNMCLQLSRLIADQR